MDHTSLHWSLGTWEALREPASAVRRRVFGEGMGIASAVDFDGTDEDATHIVAYEKDRPIATGRLRPTDANIGRMAVLPEHRSRGVGSAMLQRLLRETVRAGVREIGLHAQHQAIPFYQRHAFEPRGKRFIEAGIEHQTMTRRLEWRDAVAGVLVQDGKVLLGLRAPHIAMGDHWDLFGGKIDAGEQEHDALRRELKEEVDLEITPGPLLEIILYDDCRDQGLWRCPVFFVTKWKGTIAINEEHQDAKWVSPEEMSGLKLAHTRLRGIAQRALAGEPSRNAMRMEEMDTGP